MTTEELIAVEAGLCDVSLEAYRESCQRERTPHDASFRKIIISQSLTKVKDMLVTFEARRRGKSLQEQLTRAHADVVKMKQQVAACEAELDDTKLALADTEKRLSRYEGVSCSDGSDCLPGGSYLQLGPDGYDLEDVLDLSSVSWCKEKVFEHDVPCVRADMCSQGKCEPACT